MALARWEEATGEKQTAAEGAADSAACKNGFQLEHPVVL
jgi:hypothetical protein